MISIPQLTLPVCRSAREDVPHHCSAVATAGDPEPKSRPVIAKFNHLNLSPVTLKLKLTMNIPDVLPGTIYIDMNININVLTLQLGDIWFVLCIELCHSMN